MAGWPSSRRTPKERLSTPLVGYKLAHPMVSADGTQGGFCGVTLGRASVYRVVADAECAQGGRHSSPSRWCDCGFYCVNTLDDARALACDPDYRYAVVLEVAVSGRFLRYEKGLRYARQRVGAVRVGRCGCGHAGTVFVEAGAGTVGWRRLVAVCTSCVGNRPSITMAEFSRLLDGTPVMQDDMARPYDPVRPYDLSGASAGEDEAPADTRDLDQVDNAALVPLLTAEVALLQARLDEIQRQLGRLTERG
ncbi:hypothetical protein GCM10023321_55640 [Pseudonocardia eucalypti]|uniref:Recombination endonuclease VII n=1 Tax=Pseudonocardia eucalypti TaxID=648755 RepID=A0ABP9QQA9_9PSEU|nr:hypothetical protein [Pseudonocardia eucalypti]